ncbi:MAG: biopolymer transporter ExbD [Leptolyngbya sp. PLA3]|nr:MAG: biopolymer transporter ExbD [Cyanobacteria bacterium CYA]MCE7967625.1 biopolymer transporter ExbD [Leptolyngbya sp. PL-A3]
MRLAASQRERVARFDLTPMIDVTLQLIIFFMFSSQLGQITAAQVDLPLEPGEKVVDRGAPSFVLDMTRQGGLMLEGRPISQARFLRLVDAEIGRTGEPDNVSILVRPDRAARAGPLNQIALELRSRGVRRWKIGTTDPAGVR